MCGRFSQALPAELLVRMFGAIDLRREAPAPSWNVAPTAQVTTVGWDRERARRVIVPMTWGLLASWEKHPDAAKMKPINQELPPAKGAYPLPAFPRLVSATRRTTRRTV